MTRRPQVPVSARAIVQRINRVPVTDLQALKVTCGERARFGFGDHYVLDLNKNFVTGMHVDIE